MKLVVVPQFDLVSVFIECLSTDGEVVALGNCREVTGTMPMVSVHVGDLFVWIVGSIQQLELVNV